MASPGWTSALQEVDSQIRMDSEQRKVESFGNRGARQQLGCQSFTDADIVEVKDLADDAAAEDEQSSKTRTALASPKSESKGPVSAWKLSSPGNIQASQELREQLAEEIVAKFRHSDFAHGIVDFLYGLQDGALSQAQAELDQLLVENKQLRAQYAKSTMELPLIVSHNSVTPSFRNEEIKSDSRLTTRQQVEHEKKTSAASATSQIRHVGQFTGQTVGRCSDTSFRSEQQERYDSESHRKDRLIKAVRSATIAFNKQQRSTVGTAVSRRPDEFAAPNANAVFADADQLKQEVRNNIVKPQYSVHQYYKKKGVMQAIAKNQHFEHLALFVITINAIWLWIDIDYNRAKVLNEAEAIFQVMEYFFVVFFSFEWLIRFLAFKRKRDGFKDAWFVFDSVLLILMLLDTWAMAFLGALFDTGTAKARDTNILKLFRITRMTRMARMARLLKALPELTILIKGIWVAARSVFFTLCLLALLIYVFAVAFRQLTDGTEVGETYFKSVPYGMKALLLYATLPDMANMVDQVSAEHVILGIVLLFFILLGSLTVMNMLVGVLVEVVSVVSAVEKEEMLCNFVKHRLLDMLHMSGLDCSEDMLISRRDFELLLLKPAAAKAILEVGVDPVGLIDFSDYIFADADEEKLHFTEFIDLVLQLRGTNSPTVKDVVDLRKALMQELATIREFLSLVCRSISLLPGAEAAKSLQRKALLVREASLCEEPNEVDCDVVALAPAPKANWVSEEGSTAAMHPTSKNFHQILPGEANDASPPRCPSQRCPLPPGEDQVVPVLGDFH